MSCMLSPASQPVTVCYRLVSPMSSEHHQPIDHHNGPTDLHMNSESDDSLHGVAGSSGVITSHTQLDQSNAPITSQSMTVLAAVIAAGNETVCSAPGTKLHAA